VDGEELKAEKIEEGENGDGREIDNEMEDDIPDNERIK
jgi:hypothetical protein